MEKIEKTEEQWLAELGEEGYRVMRQRGTERPYTNRYYLHKEQGTYLCGACGLELFKSDTKYDSGSGWPAFYAPVNDANVGEQRDTSHGMIRTEVHCNRCGAHLGHVFNDGPRPTGMRYCINSVSLQFKEEK